MRRSSERAQAHTAEIEVFLDLAEGANVQLHCQIKAATCVTLCRTLIYFKGSMMTNVIFMPLI